MDDPTNQHLSVQEKRLIKECEDLQARIDAALEYIKCMHPHYTERDEVEWSDIDEIERRLKGQS